MTPPLSSTPMTLENFCKKLWASFTPFTDDFTVPAKEQE
jgi:hypothetical protein